MKKKITALFVLLALCSFFSNAADFKPAVAYDLSEILDKSFNQAIFENGATKFTEDSNIKVRNFVPTTTLHHEKGLERLARRGYNPIVAVGFMYRDALKKTAKKYPDINFVIIDTVVDLPNVKSIIFKEHEASFLVGAIAAMKTKTKKIGFVGGMNIPLIHKFSCGYEQGAKFINKNIQIFKNMAGWTNTAWNDPERGAELAKIQFSQGADIIFAAAGNTGIGVYRTANNLGKYAIGVDSNQNYLYPGVMLTSMVKLVGVATYDALKSAAEGKFKAGIDVRGLKENSVDWALDEYNRVLISPEMETEINNIKAKIITGEIIVHDYTTDNDCKY